MDILFMVLLLAVMIVAGARDVVGFSNYMRGYDNTLGRMDDGTYLE